MSYPPLILDTSFVEHLKEREVLTSDSVLSEMISHGLRDLKDCLNIKSVKVSPDQKCRDELLKMDVMKTSAELRRMGVLSKEDYERINRLVERDPLLALNELTRISPPRLRKDFYPKLVNVRNDCTLISLTAREDGILVTDDRNLYNVCVKMLGKEKCRLLI